MVKNGFKHSLHPINLMQKTSYTKLVRFIINQTLWGISSFFVSPGCYSYWFIFPFFHFCELLTCSWRKAHITRHLSQEARGCGHLVLWLDCDREGENICFEGIFLYWIDLITMFRPQRNCCRLYGRDVSTFKWLFHLSNHVFVPVHVLWSLSI